MRSFGLILSCIASRCTLRARKTGGKNCLLPTRRPLGQSCPRVALVTQTTVCDQRNPKMAERIAPPIGGQLRKRVASFASAPTRAGSRQLVDEDSRTARLSFSSEEPVEMPYGREILDHGPRSMRIGQRQQHMPLLFNHNTDDILGVVERVEVGPDRRGYATVRFGNDDRGQWAMRQVRDGILRNVSFMYQVHAAVQDDDDEDAWRVTDFSPMEISLVSVPADASVGVGRSFNFTGNRTMENSDHPSRSERRRAAAESAAALAATEAERVRVNEISAMARRHGLPDDAVSRMIAD